MEQEEVEPGRSASGGTRAGQRAKGASSWGGRDGGSQGSRVMQEEGSHLENKQQRARKSSSQRQLVKPKVITDTSIAPREKGTAMRLPCRKENFIIRSHTLFNSHQKGWVGDPGKALTHLLFAASDLHRHGEGHQEAG